MATPEAGPVTAVRSDSDTGHRASRAGAQAHRQHRPQLLSTGIAAALQEVARLRSPCFVRGTGKDTDFILKISKHTVHTAPPQPWGSRVIAVPWHRSFTVGDQLKVQERGTCCATPWGARVPAGDSPPVSSRSAGQACPPRGPLGPRTRPSQSDLGRWGSTPHPTWGRDRVTPCGH